MTLQDQVLSYLSLLGLQLSASVSLLIALTAALLAGGWLTALLFGLVGYAVCVVLQPAVLGLVTRLPEPGLFGLVALQRGGVTPQLFATTTQFRGDDVAHLLGCATATGFHGRVAINDG